MKVLVYVEGPSDRAGLEALLAPIIQVGRDNHIGISFHPQGGKSAILNDVPRKAASHLHEHPQDWVFALPDLHPMAVYDGTSSAHRSFDELTDVLRRRFAAEAARLRITAAVHTHFRFHCMKYDLEVLLLADPNSLRERLRTNDRLDYAWRRPVEDQDDNQPPKRVVEGLFAKYRGKPGYVDTIDAPWILRRAPIDAVAAGCPQRFAPFVSELRTLANGGTLDN